MKRTLPWQTPARNYYPLPKVLCRLGLSPGEIAVYSFLMYCENRTTYQCYPSYRTIGEAVGMSRNTVAKYVRQLEEKGLIRTERTTVTLKDGRRRNGSLLYTILPPEQAVEQFGESAQILMAVEEMSELQKALLKYLRFKDHEQGDEAEILAAISEERADVEIMLNQLHVIFGDNTDMEIAKLEHLCELLGE